MSNLPRNPSRLVLTTLASPEFRRPTNPDKGGLFQHTLIPECWIQDLHVLGAHSESVFYLARTSPIPLLAAGVLFDSDFASTVNSR